MKIIRLVCGALMIGAALAAIVNPMIPNQWYHYATLAAGICLVILSIQKK